MEGRLDGDVRASPTPATLQARRNDQGLVDHQDVPGAQETGQVPDPVIREVLTGPYEKQPGGVARLGGSQGDAVFRKFEVKVR